MSPLLVRMCETAAAHPYYLAHLLGPDLHATAARLGINVDACCHLYLCPVPTSGCDLARIVARGWISEGQLRAVLGW